MKRRNFFGSLFAVGAAMKAKPEATVVPPTPPMPMPTQMVTTIKESDLELVLKRYNRAHQEYINGLNGDKLTV